MYPPFVHASASHPASIKIGFVDGAQHKPGVRRCAERWCLLDDASVEGVTCNSGGQLTNSLAIMLSPVPFGWAVTLSDGRELARFTGPFAKRRALNFLAGLTAGR
jgi:hypothetical protein